MNNLNSILIEGNLTQDPELATVPSGKSVCRFSIASNRYYRNAEKTLMNEVSYVDIDTWGSLAEGCAKYLRKGRGVRVVGRLKQDRWQGDDDQMHQRYVVVAEHVEFQPDANRSEANREEDETEESPDGDMAFETPAEEPKKKKR